MNTVLDRIFGNCKKGIHRFEKFLVRETPPSKLTVREAWGVNYSEIMKSLTLREYEIRCKVCGRRAEEFHQ